MTKTNNKIKRFFSQWRTEKSIWSLRWWKPPIDKTKFENLHYCFILHRCGTVAGYSQRKFSEDPILTEISNKVKSKTKLFVKHREHNKIGMFHNYDTGTKLISFQINHSYHYLNLNQSFQIKLEGFEHFGHGRGARPRPWPDHRQAEEHRNETGWTQNNRSGQVYRFITK